MKKTLIKQAYLMLSLTLLSPALLAKNPLLEISDEDFISVFSSVPKKCIAYFDGSLAEVLNEEYANYRIVLQSYRSREATEDERQQAIEKELKSYTDNCPIHASYQIRRWRGFKKLPAEVDPHDFEDEEVQQRYVELLTDYFS